ncbi:hypothetical protein G4Z16_06470 [Streptomyces bathyalis]|uniref:Uncharacterized protein n=1 Tax=Streptomyces bathyalis TaxID=2710756 RepID=A0A7T1TCJ7_9ACTN|nr:hypothetical protein [Streptomyces bathyalis]QPP10470.1 hypothetical protein G4Z16_06470 [Streptomyces bathyalis]
MAAVRARYGASPLHLILVLASFALAGYAGVRLLEGDTLGVVLWFVGAAVVHDLVLVPLYSAADRALRAVAARPRKGHGRDAAAWREQINYVRVPAAVSLLLLLVWYPLILDRVGHYASYTGLEPGVFMGRWLLVTAALFAVSAVCLVARAARGRRRTHREDGT